jgi:hypothetical protein
MKAVWSLYNDELESPSTAWNIIAHSNDENHEAHSGCSWNGFIASPLHRTSVRSHTCRALSRTEMEKKPVSSRLYDFLFWLLGESAAFSAWSSLGLSSVFRKSRYALFVRRR